MQPQADAPGSELGPLATITLARIEEALQSGEAHCLPELVEIIHTLSAKATEISVEDLADRIEKHVAVMARVISAANTFGYNPGGAEIATLRQAIQVIGFERIRSLVTSLLLVRHAVDHESARDQKSAALHAVISGIMAQSIAGERGLVDPEIAFVSASLRQLGRLMLTAYLAEDYRTAMALSQNAGERQAFLEVFGITPLGLSHEILARAHFPKRLLDTLQEFDPKKAGRLPLETAALISLSDFSENLCALSLDPAGTPERFEQQAQLMSARYGERLAFNKEQMEHLLGFVGGRLEKFTTNLGFRAVSQDAVSAMRQRAGRRKPAQEGKPRLPTNSPLPITETRQPTATGTQAGAKPAPQGPASPATQKPGPDGVRPGETPPMAQGSPTPAKSAQDEAADIEIKARHWRDGLVSLTTCLADTTIDMGAVYSLALDFVRQGFGAPEGVLLRLDEDQRHYIPTHGVGGVFRQIRGDRAVKKDERTVLGICIARRENVLIHNTGDQKTLPYLPTWCTQHSGWGAFVAIPLHDQGGCFALMLIAWAAPLQISLSLENAKLLRSITSTVAAAKRLAHA